MLCRLVFSHLCETGSHQDDKYELKQGAAGIPQNRFVPLVSVATLLGRPGHFKSIIEKSRELEFGTVFCTGTNCIQDIVSAEMPQMALQGNQVAGEEKI